VLILPGSAPALDSESLRVSVVVVCLCWFVCARVLMLPGSAPALDSRVSPCFVCDGSSSSGSCVCSCAHSARKCPMDQIQNLSVSRLMSWSFWFVCARVLMLPGSAPALDSGSLHPPFVLLPGSASALDSGSPRPSVVLIFLCVIVCSCCPHKALALDAGSFSLSCVPPCCSGSCVLVCPEAPSP
jgi:hypothetical protein